MESGFGPNTSKILKYILHLFSVTYHVSLVCVRFKLLKFAASSSAFSVALVAQGEVGQFDLCVK